MKKGLLSILFLLIVVGGLTGCESKQNDSGDNSTKEYSFSELEKDLKKLDNNVQIIKKDASLVSATEGYGYISNNCTIEVYKFDKSTDKYKEAEKNQQIYLESFNIKIKAIVKNGYAYFVNEERSECDDVIKYVEKLVK